MKFFLLVSNLLIAFNLISQSFIKPVIINGMATEVASVETHGSTIFIVGIIPDTLAQGAIKSFLAKCNSDGEILSVSFIRPNNCKHYIASMENSMITTNDGGLVCVGYAMDTTSSSKVFLTITKYTANGDLNWYKIIDPGIPGYNVIFPYKILESESGNFYIAGGTHPGQTTRTFLAKIDGMGNLIFAKPINTVPLFNEAKGIAFLSNGNLLVSSYSHPNPLLPLETSIQRTCFIELDTTGVQVGIKCTPDTNTLAEYNVVQKADGDYLSCGCYFAHREPGYGLSCKNYIVNWDSTFSIKWDLQLGLALQENNFYDFTQNGAGDIILCGRNSVDTVGLDAGCNAVIAKVSESGHLVWLFNYQLPTGLVSNFNFRNDFFDIDVLSNGDLIAVGNWQWTQNFGSPFGVNETGIILKTGPDGCIDQQHCGLTDVSQDSPGMHDHSNQIKIWPNPSNGLFSFNLPVDAPLGLALVVYDINGHKLFAQPILERDAMVNMQFVPSGIYYYTLNDGTYSVFTGRIVVEK